MILGAQFAITVRELHWSPRQTFFDIDLPGSGIAPNDIRRSGPEYGIGQGIRAQSDDLLRVETGSLYPALHRLVRRGWLKAEWGISEANQRAKYYRLTAAGKAQLVRERDRWSQLVHAIGLIMNPEPNKE